MEYIDKNFADFKKQTMSKLHHALENDLVDRFVVPILNIINAIEGYVSTSSCSGRIVTMEVPIVGDKKNAVFHGKWHQAVTFNELKKSIAKYGQGQCWFIAQSPIFHIASDSLEAADALVKISVSSGFKHSGFKGLNERIIIELVSTERMDVPLGTDGLLMVSDEYLAMLQSLGNGLLKRSHKKLKRLETNLSKF